MKYNFYIQNNALILTAENAVILSGIRVRVNYVRSMNVTYIPNLIETSDNTTTVTFRRETERDWMWEADYVKLVFTEAEGAVLVKADFACRKESFAYNYTYPSYESAFIDFDLPEEQDGLLSLHNAVPFWLTPAFTDETDSFAHIQSLAYRVKSKHIHILPLVNKELKTHIEKNTFVLSTNVPDKQKICADTFILAAASDPFKAISENFTAGRTLGAITVKPVSEREYPETFDGFGWCTWNAFYKEVTADKVYEKLDELKAKGVKLKWLMVDDGWHQFEGRKLLSFREDPKKFPEGFKGFTSKVKNDYGVKYVGVWHAFGGYWDGIHKDGEIYKEHRDLLFENSTGWVFPGETEEKAFEFWDIWHSYLKEQGIDFVKVDNQASTPSKFDGALPGSSAAFIQHEALEKSVFKNFGGAIINCMGCDMENILTRPHSAVDRNSDDFFPQKEHGFIAHINRNVYVSPIHNQVHHLDFDMFWTDHSESTISAVLRAISGGPVYVSDEVGKTDAQALRPLVLPNGDIWRMDTAAKVTKDLYYTDCSKEGVPIKIWSKSGENIAVAAFGITPYKTVSGALKLRDIPNTREKYLVHDFFGDSYFVLNKESKVEFKTDYKTCRLYTLYPIADDDTVLLGNGSYYAEAADPNTKRVAVKDIVKS